MIGIEELPVMVERLIFRRTKIYHYGNLTIKIKPFPGR